MYFRFDDINDSIQFCLDVIAKEVKQDDRLVKQVFLTLLSTYTRNPINLAINAPTGEGKSYVVSKVAELFPQSDVIFLTAMTDKALFHRQGTLVIKNKETGEYEPIEDKIADIDSEIEDKESEIHSTKDSNLKQGLRSQIKELNRQKREMLKGAMKRIDLNHKVLIFADTPKHTLLEAIMSLLSHDRYEVEYEFVDTFNGIKTKSNVLRGFPTVIFTAAVDYSKHPRWAETQRRFIITNPNMSPEKYKESIQLMGARSALPDFVYGATIVSQNEKDQARELIKGLKDRILSITERNTLNSPNVFIPFYESIEKALPSNKASDMTTAQRLYNYMTLFPIINIDKRPRLIIRNRGDPMIKTCPFATFDDLRDSIYLMEYSNGIRPYILEWFNEVFLVAYNEKTTPNTKSNDDSVSEEIIALTTAESVKATEEFRGKKFSVKQMYENYIDPLINAGYVDCVNSKIDGRAHIYFPVLNSKQRKLFDSEKTNNLSHNKIVSITDPALFPNKIYLISKIQGVLRYSSEEGIIIKLEDHQGNEITVEELVDRYYAEPENYFELDSKINNITPGDPSSGQPLFLTATDEDRITMEAEQQSLSSPLSKSSIQRTREEQGNNLVKQRASDDYLGNTENASQLQESIVENNKSVESQGNLSKKLFDMEKTNNLFYSCQSQTEIQNKEQRSCISSKIVPSTEEVSPLPQPQLQKQGEQQHKKFNCFYCSQAYSSDKERVKHVDYEHPGKMYYPTQEDFEKRLL
jgi:hypothetical protein